MVCIKEEQMRTTEDEDEDLIQHLLSYLEQHSHQHQPETELDLQTTSSMNFDHQICLSQHNMEMSTSTTITNNNTTKCTHYDYNNNSSSSSSNHNNNVVMNTTATSSSSNAHHSQQEQDDTDIEMEFNRYPKTEPITEQFTTHIFDNFFNLITRENREEANSRKKALIRHDCMWAGSCESETHQDMHEELVGPSSGSAFDFTTLDDVDFYSNADPLRQFTSLDEGVEEEDEHMTLLRSMTDHSYAFHGIGPIPQHSSESQQPPKSIAAAPPPQPLQSPPSSSSPKHFQGIVIKEEISEESSTRRTKIMVPLKDLLETLHQKSFLVAPLGPGKKVITFTGNGDTVKGVFSGAQFKSSKVSSSTISSFATSTSLAGRCSSSVLSSVAAGKATPRKPTPKKAKKAIHKPKQELSPSSPVRGSSLVSSLSHGGGNNLVNDTFATNGKPKKTKAHNNMERMRRIDLRNSFDALKKLVPSLNKVTKCSKVEILKKSSEYINSVLKATEKRILREEHNLKVRNESLRSRLAYLASNN